jgi:hypothetical protein
MSISRSLAVRLRAKKLSSYRARGAGATTAAASASLGAAPKKAAAAGGADSVPAAEPSWGTTATSASVQEVLTALAHSTAWQESWRRSWRASRGLPACTLASQEAHRWASSFTQ